jgi:hypothetical protein
MHEDTYKLSLDIDFIAIIYEDIRLYILPEGSQLCVF